MNDTKSEIPGAHANSKQGTNNFLKIAIGSALGLGLSPVAPGTLGALLGVLLHVLVALYLPFNFQIVIFVGALIFVAAANYLLTPWARMYWHSEDPRHFVLDEIAGYLMVPIFFHGGQLWQSVVWGFVLFRVFDIVKLPIARQIDRKMKDSWGILLDDLVSGGYAVIVMYIFLWIGPMLGIENWLIAPV